MKEHDIGLESSQASYSFVGGPRHGSLALKVFSVVERIRSNNSCNSLKPMEPFKGDTIKKLANRKGRLSDC